MLHLGPDEFGKVVTFIYHSKMFFFTDFFSKRLIFDKVKGNAIVPNWKFRATLKHAFKIKLVSFPKKSSAALKYFVAFLSPILSLSESHCTYRLWKKLVVECHCLSILDHAHNITILSTVIKHHSPGFSLFSSALGSSVVKHINKDAEPRFQNSCLPYSKPTHYQLSHETYSFAYNLFIILCDHIMMMDCLCTCRWGPTCCWAGCLRGWPAGARAGGWHRQQGWAGWPLLQVQFNKETNPKSSLMDIN